MAVPSATTLSLLIPTINDQESYEKFFKNFSLDVEQISDQTELFKEVETDIDTRIFAILNAVTQAKAMKNKKQAQLAPPENYSIRPLDSNVENKLSKYTCIKSFCSQVNNGSCDSVAKDLVRQEEDAFHDNCVEITGFALTILQKMKQDLDIDSFTMIEDTTTDKVETFEGYYSSLTQRISSGSVYYTEYADIVAKLFDNINILANNDSKKLCFHKKGMICFEESSDFIRAGKSTLNSAKKYLGGSYLGFTPGISYRAENLVQFAEFLHTFIKETRLATRSRIECENKIVQARAGLTKLSQNVYGTKEKTKKVISRTIETLEKVQECIKSQKFHSIDDQIAIFLTDSNHLSKKEQIKLIAFRFESYLGDFYTIQGKDYPILRSILGVKNFEMSLLMACLLVEKSLKNGKDIEEYCKLKLNSTNSKSFSEDLLRAKLAGDLVIFGQVRSEKIIHEKALEEIKSKRKGLYKTRRANLIKAGIKLIGGSAMAYFAYQSTGVLGGALPTAITYAADGAKKLKAFVKKTKVFKVWPSQTDTENAAKDIQNTNTAIKQEASSKVIFKKGLSDLTSCVIENFIRSSPVSSPHSSPKPPKGQNNRAEEKKVDQNNTGDKNQDPEKKN